MGRGWLRSALLAAGLDELLPLEAGEFEAEGFNLVLGLPAFVRKVGCVRG